MPQYTTKHDFLRYNIFTSYFIDRRVFLREFVFQYASMKTQKSRVLVRGKITSLLRKITERDQLRVSSQSSPRINHNYAHHESHLHTMKVVSWSRLVVSTRKAWETDLPVVS